VKRINNFLITLFLGNNIPDKNIRPAIQNQVRNVKQVWNNETYNDFGVERLFRLFLTLFQFFSIGLYVRHISGWFGLLGRKVGVEILVLAKLAFPILLLTCGWTAPTWTANVAAYLLVDTIIYLNYLIFLTDVNTKPITYKRSLVTLFHNYIEVALNFAVIYSHCNLVYKEFFSRQLKNNFESVYFSFITTATVGYGDIYPNTTFGQFLTVSQVILFFIFVGLFLNFYASKVETKSYFNEELKFKKREAKK